MPACTLLGGEAKALADRHLFETLVRVHRAGEGTSYTGLKPAGRDLGPAIPAADRALEDGSIDKVVKLLNEAVRRGCGRRLRARLMGTTLTASRLRNYTRTPIKKGRRIKSA